MKCLITADWHISGTMPRCRADEDWMESQRQDIMSVLAIAKESNVDEIWIIGDLFDHARVSAEAVNLVLECFGKSPCLVRVLCGNHDLPYHSFNELKRSSIGTILHTYPMLETSISAGLAAFPFGTEPENISAYMKENGLSIWATHQLTFPDDSSRPIEGIGVLAQELLDMCPEAKVILTGDYHHAFVYTAKDGRKVINPGCLNIGDADMSNYAPRVYVMDTGTYDEIPYFLPLHGTVETSYLDRAHELDDMKAKFVETVSSGSIAIKSFKEALDSEIPTLPKGVQDILLEVQDSLVPV